MLLPLLLWSTLSPQLGSPGTIQVGKTDTLLSLLTKISQSTKQSYFIDGTINNKPLEIEGSYLPEALLEEIRKSTDYKLVIKNSRIIVYKRFSNEKTRPDYSLLEAIHSFKETKRILAPFISKRDHEIASTRFFEDAISILSPQERAQIESEGILIGNLPANARQQIINAIYYKEFGTIYFQASRTLPLLEGLNTSTISINSSPAVLMVSLEKDTQDYRFFLNNSRTSNNAKGEFPLPSTTLGAFLVDTQAIQLLKIPDSLKDYKITIGTDTPRFDPQSLKLISELNKWKFASDTLKTPPIYSISNTIKITGLNLAGHVISAMPCGVQRFMTFPLFPEAPIANEYQRITFFSRSKANVAIRMQNFVDDDLLHIAEYKNKHSQKLEILYKDLPTDIKNSIINIIFMKSLINMYNDLIDNSYTPNQYMIEPETATIQKTIHPDNTVSYTVKSPNGGLFSLREAIRKKPDSE